VLAAADGVRCGPLPRCRCDRTPAQHTGCYPPDGTRTVTLPPCRGSYLYFTGSRAFHQVMNTKHTFLHRRALEEGGLCLAGWWCSGGSGRAVLATIQPVWVQLPTAALSNRCTPCAASLGCRQVILARAGSEAVAQDDWDRIQASLGSKGLLAAGAI